MDMRVGFVAVMVWGGCVGVARGQWTVRDLNPAHNEIETYRFSQVNAMSQGRQGGQAALGGPVAGLWSGTAESWVSLSPAGFGESAVDAMDGDLQAGYAILAGAPHAGIWRGSAATWVDLHPAGASRSWINGAKGGVQVGSARVNGVTHAGLWRGTAGSWVDLHPAWATGSYANAVDGGQQGGVIFDETLVFPRAAIWSGTAESVVLLHPDAVSSSVMAMDGGRQVGWVSCLTMSPDRITASRAVVWSGTDSLCVDLHPIGAMESEALAIHGAYQAGDVLLVMPSGQEVRRASVWRGTADSWEELPLPEGREWYWTIATSVWVEGGTLYAAGYGRPLYSEERRAMLWSRPIGEGVCFSSGADFDGDGAFATPADVEAFFACLGGQCCATCLSRGADFDGDGDVGTDRDIEEFFRVMVGIAC